MSRWPTLAILPILLLGSCETAAPTDVVPDERTAIEIAKRVCPWAKVGGGWKWHAKLRHGTWYVWINVDYKWEESEAINSLEIRARDGFTEGCAVVT